MTQGEICSKLRTLENEYTLHEVKYWEQQSRTVLQFVMNTESRDCASVRELSGVDGVLPDVDLAVVEALQVLVGGLLDIVEHRQLFLELRLAESEAAQKVVLVAEDVLEVGSRVPAVPRGEHDEAGVVLAAVLEGDADRSGDALGILRVVLPAAVAEGALLHERARGLVEEGLVAVVLGLEHEQLPDAVQVAEALQFALQVGGFEGLPEDGADDVHHRVVGRLPRRGSFLRGVADDAERGLVGHDVDVLDVLDRLIRRELRLVNHLLQAFQGPRRLMLVQPQLEVHSHHCEVVALVRQSDVEGTAAFGRLEVPEDGLRVPEDIFGAHESSHCSFDAHQRSLSGDCRRSSLRVAELLACPNGPPGDVVCNDHADGTFDLFGRGPHQRSVRADGGNGPVDHVIDFVAFQGEDLTKSASDFVLHGHGLESHCPVDLGVDVRGGDNHGVEVVVAELACLSALLVGVPEHSSVRVPLPDGRRVGDHRLLDGNVLVASEDLGLLDLGVLGQNEFEGLVPQDVWGVALEGQGRETADYRVGVEHASPFENFGAGGAFLHEPDGVFAEVQGLVGVLLQDGRREQSSD